MLLVWCRLTGGVGEKKRAEGTPLLTSRPDRRSDARRLGGSDRAPKVTIRRHVANPTAICPLGQDLPADLARATPKTPTESHQTRRLDHHRATLMCRFLARNHRFSEKWRRCRQSAQRCAQSGAMRHRSAVFDEKGRRFCRQAGPSGVELVPAGANPVAPRTKGLALIHIVFYFSTSPSFGVEYGQAARRVGQSGGPEHGSKEEAQGRCEA